MRVSFIWQGVSGRYGFWQDGLYKAMQHIEKEHEVEYIEPLQEPTGDVLLYWEAPVTANGKDAEHYNRIRYMDKPKALLFAGGEVTKSNCDGFDLFFVESEINEHDFDRIGKPWRRAFGVNEEALVPMMLEKKYDAYMQATFAGWKRHELFARSVGAAGAVSGRKQEHDMNGYNRCVDEGVQIFPELTMEEVAQMINKSHTVLNTAEYWGGGQRCTLEAMACNVPPIVMSDAPKNREYVEESGFGLVVDPDPEAIRRAIQHIKDFPRVGGRAYIESKWTSKHYADAILKGIKTIV